MKRPLKMVVSTSMDEYRPSKGRERIRMLLNEQLAATSNWLRLEYISMVRLFGHRSHIRIRSTF